MPVKKATRSTRSTRTTKASSQVPSSDAVLDENINASTITDVKKKSSKSTSEPKKVLGERNAPNSDVPTTSSKSRSTTKSTSTTPSKLKTSSKPTSDSAEPVDSGSTTPTPPSPRLPEEQIQAVLSNYDLEIQARTSRLRASLEMSVQSSITRMRLAIERIPRAVRQLSLAEFIDSYGADIHAFMNNAPVTHLKETQEEWDQIREERSPAKAKRSRTDKEVSKGKPSRATKKSQRSKPVELPTSPISASANPAPSLAKFKPDLPKEALKTPKPRMARPGEVITWHSINGSPICGVIGEDGVVRPVQFA